MALSEGQSRDEVAVQMESHPWRRCSWSDQTLWQTWMFFLSHEFCDVVTFEGGECGLERVMMNVL